jgi:hypothetical protein
MNLTTTMNPGCFGLWWQVKREAAFYPQVSFTSAGQYSSARKRRHRFALPTQSKSFA